MYENGRFVLFWVVGEMFLRGAIAFTAKFRKAIFCGHSFAGEKYISMVPYAAQNNDELSYGAGEEIEALQKSSYGWWKVR